LLDEALLLAGLLSPVALDFLAGDFLPAFLVPFAAFFPEVFFELFEAVLETDAFLLFFVAIYLFLLVPDNGRPSVTKQRLPISEEASLVVDH